LGHHRIKWRRNIAENFNRLSRVHERYRRQTDGRRHVANMNMSSRSQKIGSNVICFFLTNIICSVVKSLFNDKVI